jgi:KDO2-lipid IV(A) lauroyltransferase
VARDFFRQLSCEAIDIMRPATGRRALSRQVEIRGLDHLETALSAGKGAIICSAHFGSYNSCFSVLNNQGFPLTTIGRWQYKYTKRLSSAERRLWKFVYERRVIRQRRRPNIEPWTGRLATAVEAATLLRANEVVTICVDAPPLPSDRARTVAVEMFGRQVNLLPGVVSLAQFTGAAVLMTFLYRWPDYHHQTLEISEPLELAGDPAVALGQIAAELEAAIRRRPSHWVYWSSEYDLAELGLLSPSLVDSAAT